MQPIDYTSQVKQPFDQSIGGFESGLAMRQALDQQQLKDMALQQAKQQQIDVNALAADPNPTATKYATIMTKYPSLSEHFKRGWDVLNADQQQAKLGQATQVYAALNANQPDIAIQLLNDHAAALRNSNREDEAKQAEMMAKFIAVDPKSAKTSAGLALAATMPPDKFADTFTKLQGDQRTAELQPSVVAEAQSKADKAKSDASLAEITARYGEKNAITDLAKKGWDIKNIESEIASRKETNRIAALNAAINGANSQTEKGRLTLERDKFVAEQGQKVRDRVADVTAARNTIDNMLNTADQVLKHPGLQQATGSIAARLPSLRQDSADFDAMIENLTSQEFSSQVATLKGMGSLSNAEGEKLATALQNIRTTQSASQLSTNVKEAQRLMLKARANLVTRYGVPDTTPDTPAAAPTADELSALLAKHGSKNGGTRGDEKK